MLLLPIILFTFNFFVIEWLWVLLFAFGCEALCNCSFARCKKSKLIIIVNIKMTYLCPKLSLTNTICLFTFPSSAGGVQGSGCGATLAGCWTPASPGRAVSWGCLAILTVPSITLLWVTWSSSRAPATLCWTSKPCAKSPTTPAGW